MLIKDEWIWMNEKHSHEWINDWGIWKNWIEKNCNSQVEMQKFRSRVKKKYQVHLIKPSEKSFNTV